MDIYLPRTPGLRGLTEIGIARSQGNPPNFYPPHMNVGPAIPPLLPPLWPHCVSMPLCLSPHLYPPTCLDERGSLKCLVVGLTNSSFFWEVFFKFFFLFLRSSCNSFFGCSGRRSLFTYASTLIRSPWIQRFWWLLVFCLVLFLPRPHWRIISLWGHFFIQGNKKSHSWARPGE